MACNHKAEKSHDHEPSFSLSLCLSLPWPALCTSFDQTKRGQVTEKKSTVDTMVRLIIASLLVAFVAAEGSAAGRRELTRVVDPMLSPLKLAGGEGKGEGRELAGNVNFMILKGRDLAGDEEDFMPLKGRELAGDEVDFMPLKGRQLAGDEVDFMPLKGRQLIRLVDPMRSPLKGRELRVMDPMMLNPVGRRELTGGDDEGRKLTRVVDPMLSPLKGRELAGDDQCAETCEHVRYKSMCRNIARRPEVTTALSLLEAALRLSASKAKAARARFAAAAKASHEGNPMASILSSCVQSYGDLVDELAAAQRCIDSGAGRAALLSKLSAAGTYAGDCDNWFEERELKSPYQRMQTHVSRVVANALGIAAHNEQLP